MKVHSLQFSYRSETIPYTMGMTNLISVDVAALEKVALTGERIVVMLKSGLVAVGFPHQMMYGLDPIERTVTKLTGFMFDETTPQFCAGELFEAEDSINLDDVAAIHIVKRTLTAVGGK